jgi:ABC-2 type transport system permease protein
MSAAEAPFGAAPPAAGPVAVARPRRRPSTRFLRSELHLIFGRRRNLAGLGVLAAVPILIAVAVKVSTPRSDGRGPDFFAAITGNGIFVALAALGIELGLFLPLAVAAISGDAVAGEANLGTLRYLLAIPVSRTRLLAVKYAAIAIFSLVATLWVSLVGVVVGVAIFGGGNLTLLSGAQIGFGQGLWRVLLASLYLAAGFASLGAVGLFVSTLTEQPIGATIAVVIVNVASFILDSIPQLDWLHPWLLTHWWVSFGDLLRDPIAWDGIARGLFTAAGYILVFWLAAWARFAGKDVTS